MTDYLGSVRAVVDGNTGELYKAVDYSTFGEENAVTIPQWGSAAAISLATATLHDGTSPYAFCNNNPVNLVDPDGRKVRLADNSTPEFKLKLYQNLLYMISKGTAGDLLDIHSSDKVYI